MRRRLSDDWTVRAVGGEVPAGLTGVAVPAFVPGCIHTDLQTTGLIPDPLLDENEASLGWIGLVDWRYETVFDWPEPTAGDEVDLVAMGLDTIATIELNGTVVARTRNMHRSYRFPVAGLLRPAGNRLAVTFGSALTAARQMSAELGPRPATVPHPINAIRKMACNFGADWGPELITAGIWRPLLLESWGTARIGTVRPLVDLDGTTGLLHAHIAVQRQPGHDGELTVQASIGGARTQVTVAPDQHDVVLDLAVADARLWWPHGYGDQARYRCDVALFGPEGRLDDWTAQVGFRAVTVDTAPDEEGTSFVVSVNGAPLFIRGVNWIPDDPFPARVDAAHYRSRLQQARDAHANLVRVWGGGIFEDDVFYDLCDELGLLVWQDFLFNCACYAEEEPLRGEIVAEAREAVTRLSRHPSLAIWNGCNENLWGYQDWNWKTPLAGQTWGAGYYFDLLPSIVSELDPGRPYLPGSPYSFSDDRHPLDPAHGTTHIWDVWNERDYTAYRDYAPRFCAEFGFQGPPTWATLTRAIHDQPLAPDSPGMVAHEKAADGLGKLNRGLQTHLRLPTNFADWHWATSLNQARAIALGVEHFRSLAPVCRGTIVWQLNDCWPVTSWAAVDGDGRPKPMWYALRRSYRDRLLTFQQRDSGLALIAVNDSAQPWIESIDISRRRFDGAVQAKITIPLHVAPRGALTVDLPTELSNAQDPTSEVIAAHCSTTQAWWHFLEDIEAALPRAELEAHVDTMPGGYRLTVTAHTMVRDLAVLVDRLDPDAVVDDMLITLLPADVARFEIRSTATLTIEELTDPLVLRSANQLGAR